VRYPGSPFSRADDLLALAWQLLLKSACTPGSSSSSSGSGSLDPARCLALLWQLQAADSAEEEGGTFGVLAAEVKAAAGRLHALPGAALCCQGQAGTLAAEGMPAMPRQPGHPR
jgi:hypothetical protein